MAETRYLISVGINDYELNSLDYCVKDLNDLNECLQTFCKVDSLNTYSVMSDFNQPNSNPYDSIIQIFSRIKSQFIEKEDSIFFYFSGHGAKSTNSTTIMLKNKGLEIQELFDMFNSLQPKFIFILIDSCYSGVGILDTISLPKSEVSYNQELMLASGYNIICASAFDAPAKESSDIKNGRLTRLFIDIIQNKINYNNGILNLSKVFQLIDNAFKNYPEFRQFPFSQTKGLSTYPISFIEDNIDKSYYSTHYIDDVEKYNWELFQIDLAQYCNIKTEIIYEFTRLTRELLRNCLMWNKATFVKIEIGNNSVSIIDNSGLYFDIFNPPHGTKIRGGGKTAKVFLENFESEYKFEYFIGNGETIQIFNFNSPLIEEDLCSLDFKGTYELWEFQNARTIDIPLHCKDYKIHIPHGYLDLSTVNIFLKAAILSSQKSNKEIFIIIDDKDRLKHEFVTTLEHFNHLGGHKVQII